MKTLSRVMLFSCLSLGALFAQPPMRPRAAGAPPDPATMVKNHVDRLTTLLSLTADQATQATTIFLNAANAAATLQTTLNDTRKSMEDAVKANNTATIDSLAATIGAATGQITAVQSKADAAFYAILTTDQKTKLDALPGGGRGPGMGGMGGMGMGPGMGPQMRGGRMPQ